MLVTHDYVTLKVNGNRYLEKAPLMYWAGIAVLSVFRRERVRSTLAGRGLDVAPGAAGYALGTPRIRPSRRYLCGTVHFHKRPDAISPRILIPGIHS